MPVNWKPMWLWILQWNCAKATHWWLLAEPPTASPIHHSELSCQETDISCCQRLALQWQQKSSWSRPTWIQSTAEDSAFTWLLTHYILISVTPDRNLSIDKSIVKFNGHVFFRQYLHSKLTRLGVKEFVLCEAKTGYHLKHIIYTLWRQLFLQIYSCRLAHRLLHPFWMNIMIN